MFLLFWAVACFLAGLSALAVEGLGTMTSNRRALILGRGDPYRDPGGSMTHPQVAGLNFLRCVGNPTNNPAKGWTCDFSWDLMVRLGMDPTNTTLPTLFNYIGEHHLGYRIAINNGPGGYAADYWGSAVDNGMMPFAPQGNNQRGERLDDPLGLRSAVGVTGGYTYNLTSWGPGVEFFDYAFEHDYAQSWANQAAAAKFALILDAHPEYNIWDAREHMRQAGSFWERGWTETNGYGRANEKAGVGKLLPGAPVDFRVEKFRDRHGVRFTWRNFLQTGFAATVIARKDGRILYEGRGTNFVWTSDVNGNETFLYWSKNVSGEKSRIESYQRRQVSGLSTGPNQSCLVAGVPVVDEDINDKVYNTFKREATNWVCDVIYRPGHAFYDKATAFPFSHVIGVMRDITGMVNYAISNHYRIMIAPISLAEQDPYQYKSEWDRATAAGILVVTPHHVSRPNSRKPAGGRKLSPPRLFSAITVGSNTTNRAQSFGPGLEFFDAPVRPVSSLGEPTEAEAAAVIAGKLARIFDAHPEYNAWDARQHLRQSASLYSKGWVEESGFGKPVPGTRIKKLEIAPPLEIRAEKSSDGRKVTFSWETFLQSSFAETVIKRDDGSVLYHGRGTQFSWESDVDGEETFKVFSKDKEGRLSREESFTVLHVEGLKANR